MAVTLSNKTKREISKQIECGDSIPDFYLPLLPGSHLIEIQDKATTCNNQKVLAQLRSLVKPATAPSQKKQKTNRNQAPPKHKKKQQTNRNPKPTKHLKKKAPAQAHLNENRKEATHQIPLATRPTRPPELTRLSNERKPIDRVSARMMGNSRSLHGDMVIPNGKNALNDAIEWAKKGIEDTNSMLCLCPTLKTIIRDFLAAKRIRYLTPTLIKELESELMQSIEAARPVSSQRNIKGKQVTYWSC